MRKRSHRCLRSRARRSFTRVVPVPKGKVLHDVPLPIPLLDADVIIDAAKAKTHENTKITGALKNWVGVVNQHWRQHNHGADTCARFMDIMTVVPPDLCVIDAIICGEGDGPIANLPRWCGAVMATTDPVAADIAIARLFQHDWRNLQYPNEADSTMSLSRSIKRIRGSFSSRDIPYCEPRCRAS